MSAALTPPPENRTKRNDSRKERRSRQRKEPPDGSRRVSPLICRRTVRGRLHRRADRTGSPKPAMPGPCLAMAA